jgi:hypothetical protein
MVGFFGLPERRFRALVGGIPERVEDRTVQKLIREPGIEAFAGAVLPT